MQDTATDDSLETRRPPFGRTRRDRVYLALRAAGLQGLSHRELQDRGLMSPFVHVESLRLEGHRIESIITADGAGRPIRHFILQRDAWANVAAP